MSTLGPGRDVCFGLLAFTMPGDFPGVLGLRIFLHKDLFWDF